MVRERWRDHLTDYPDVPANVSVRAPSQDTAGRLGLGQVYAECTLMARERASEPLLDAVERELAGRLFATRRDGISLQVTALLKNGSELWLAPAWWWSQALERQTALRDQGSELLSRDVLITEAGVVVAGREGTSSIHGIFSGRADALSAAAMVAELASWSRNIPLVGYAHVLERLAPLVESAEVVNATLATNPLEA